MRQPLLTGLAAAAALTLIVGAPALADDAPGEGADAAAEPTVTSFSVPADLAIDIPYDVPEWGDSGSLTGSGLTYETPTYPIAPEYDGNAAHQTFAMTAVAAEGCVRTVDSFNFAYTLATYNYMDLGFDSIPISGGIATGTPLTAPLADHFAAPYTDGLTMLPLVNDQVTTTGDGHVHFETTKAHVEFETMRQDPAPQSGTMSIDYPTAVDTAAARGYISVTSPLYASWLITDASFTVTDTCAAVTPPVVEPPVVEPPVVEPPVVEPPVVEPPVVGPPVVVDPSATVPPAVTTPTAPPVQPVVAPKTIPMAKTLANTGAADDAAGAGVAALLLLGAGASAIAFARRRAQRTA
ncbi:hypothetical protein JOF28_001116 [Leucobacter exalbidus]|uniref:Gram-positive cocci surface proteins LPxTG domain-containing protein n=1 Tax=Leucobacter exalbidus TaxID=662960 RepID=A0A940PV62_9MICO|nr:hypothetical protein [Leucobacter exalbidus]MBP1325884.1 hypothetical protein [Leucobacter exalbidus]